MRTNYCHGCPRFSPAVGWEKENGNPYGRCLRVIDMEEEFPEMWRIIPSRAIVARGYYHIQDQKQKSRKLPNKQETNSHITRLTFAEREYTKRGSK